MPVASTIPHCKPSHAARKQTTVQANVDLFLSAVLDLPLLHIYQCTSSMTCISNSDACCNSPGHCQLGIASLYTVRASRLQFVGRGPLKPGLHALLLMHGFGKWPYTVHVPYLLLLCPSTSWVLPWCHHLSLLHRSVTICYIGVIIYHCCTAASPFATLCRLSSVKHAATTGMLHHWTAPTAATQQHLARLSQMRRARRKGKPPNLRGYVSQVGQAITACFTWGGGEAGRRQRKGWDHTSVVYCEMVAHKRTFLHVLLAAVLQPCIQLRQVKLWARCLGMHLSVCAPPCNVQRAVPGNLRAMQPWANQG